MMRWVLKVLLVIEGSTALQTNLALEDKLRELAVQASDVWDFDTLCWMNEKYFDQESNANLAKLAGLKTGNVKTYCDMMADFLNIASQNVQDDTKFENFAEHAGKDNGYRDWMKKNYEKHKVFDLNTYCRVNEDYFAQESRAALAVLANGDVKTYCAMKADFLYIANKDVEDGKTFAKKLADVRGYYDWMQNNYKKKEDFDFQDYCDMNKQCFEQNSRAELYQLAKKDENAYCMKMADFLNIASQNVEDDTKLQKFQKLAKDDVNYYGWMQRNYPKKKDSTQTAGV